MAAIEIKPIREVMKAVQPIIDAAGASCRLENGSGAHPKLIIELNGKTRQTQLSTSPRTNGQAVKYKVSDVRRILREMET